MTIKLLINNDSKATLISKLPEYIISPLKNKLKISKIISYQNFKQNYQKYIINNSYLKDSSDNFIAQNSKNAYMINNDKISCYDYNKLYLKQINKKGTIIALMFSVIYFVLGMLLNWNFNLIGKQDLLFESDTRRVYFDFTSITYNHDRIIVHPLFLFFQPFIFLIRRISQNNILAILLFQIFVSFLCIKYLYQTLCILNKNNQINSILIIIFGFSFSSLIFLSTIETYALSALSLILIWFNIIKDIKFKNKINIYKYVGLGILTTGILITNYFMFTIGTIILLLSKKINIKKMIIIHIVTIISIIILSYIQQFIWMNTPNIPDNLMNTINTETKEYVNFDIKIDNIQNLGNDVYLSGFIANDINVTTNQYNSRVMTFSRQFKIRNLFLIGFYICLIYLIIKNFKKQKLLNFCLLLCLITMSILHLIYGNVATFLYSQHFLYLIILLYGLNYQEEYPKIKLFLKAFWFIEILINFGIFNQILFLVSTFAEATFWLKGFSILEEIIIFSSFIIIIIFLLSLIYLCFKRYFKTYMVSYLIGVILCVLIMSCLFIKFN